MDNAMEDFEFVVEEPSVPRLADRMFIDYYRETPERKRTRDELITAIESLQPQPRTDYSGLAGVIKFVLDQ